MSGQIAEIPRAESFMMGLRRTSDRESYFFLAAFLADFLAGFLAAFLVAIEISPFEM
jgi:hypothetical protein